MIKSNKISSIIVMLAALLMLMPLSGSAQSITRNKKKAATTATAKKQRDQSSKSTGTSVKNLPAPIKQLIADMVSVKGGTFTMGASIEQGSDAWDVEYPPHRVKVSSYQIGKYEVTQAQWKAVMGNNPSYFKGDNLPVETISWNDCQTFIRKLNKLTGIRFRLPTEAEWEYAARGGNQSGGCKYAGSNDLGRIAWYKDNSGSRTHPVGSKAPNELGLYDMSGNVAEWCQDWYSRYNGGEQIKSFRMYRGGCWQDNPTFGRVSIRLFSPPNVTVESSGLRLAM